MKSKKITFGLFVLVALTVFLAAGWTEVTNGKVSPLATSVQSPVATGR